MIGSLRGVLTRKEPPYLLVEVNGVGYELAAPMSTIFTLPALGSEIYLCTHLVVREDQQTLFGFATEAERRLFRDLLKVSGVGAKMALTILSGISVQGFVSCVKTEDVATLVKLPGVGRKTAERLVLDMRDRIAGGTGADAASAGNGAGVAGHETRPARAEAFNALVSLGYKPAEARRMLDEVAEAELSTEELLREVLRAAAS